MKHPDIDIDFADRNMALMSIDHIPAMLITQNGKRQVHNSGVYLQDIPVDPFTDLSALPYTETDALGYFKIDFLNQSIYEMVRDEDHLCQLMNTEPMWEILAEREFVAELAQIHNHYDVVNSIKPQSVEDLAVVLALIRPAGRKYIGADRETIDANIWNQSDDEKYRFKKSHAISYAVLITVQMNLLVESLSN